MVMLVAQLPDVFPTVFQVDPLSVLRYNTVQSSKNKVEDWQGLPGLSSN